MTNRLADETSPYLQQHKDNPVHWWPWGAAALKAARDQDKPILLSVGYAACHWCHVMAHESFESPEIAAQMNDRFINIKVDREERPDIDTIYMNALHMLGEQGGWPLTMFLTPAAEPYWGGTYFPPEPRFGRPGFPQVLEAMANAWATDKDAVAKNTTALVTGLQKLARTAEGEDAPPLTGDLFDTMAGRLIESVDMDLGGIGGAPKFPHTFALEFLWRAHGRTGDPKFGDAVQVSLDQMAQGGIYDHVGGGYARYATDAAWLVPHFEKMLYDNALLIDLMTQVWQATGSRLYKARIRETVGWTLREMVAEGGGFAASLDADSEGEEGKYYVWSATEIDAALGVDAAMVREVFGVTPGGNWEGKNILNRSHAMTLHDAQFEGDLARACNVLYDVREQRVRPGWDDKVLADWNGMMIAAMARASAVFNEPGWLAAAVRAWTFIAETMRDGDRLWHAARDGKVRNAGMLEDYANMAQASLALFEVTGEARFLERAGAWSATLDSFFWDDEQGGYYQTASDGEQLIARPRNATDNAVPSGNGTMVGVLARLYLHTGEEAYRARAHQLIDAFTPEIARNFFGLMTFLNNVDLWVKPVQVAVIGDRKDPGTKALVNAAYALASPNLVLSVIAPDAALPASHPAAGKTQMGGNATAYVCIGETCSLPVTDAAKLGAAVPGV
ncbi:MAG: thioredoxin domain-containing protein [Proteobacteria bacterium]|nr:thioredoxin domain-containing protein [Pseudomonadota bacterium]MDA1057852.1 thioredoxin domain-containing protein [Pseudomonadota bacterium]